MPVNPRLPLLSTFYSMFLCFYNIRTQIFKDYFVPALQNCIKSYRGRQAQACTRIWRKAALSLISVTLWFDIMVKRNNLLNREGQINVYKNGTLSLLSGSQDDAQEDNDKSLYFVNITLWFRGLDTVRSNWHISQRLDYLVLIMRNLVKCRLVHMFLQSRVVGRGFQVERESPGSPTYGSCLAIL